MLIAWDSAASDGAIVTAGSQITTLPGSNVQHPHLARKWHTPAGVKSSHLLYDMLASRTVRILMVVGTNLTPAATYRVRASDLDPAALANLLLDTTTLAAGVKAGYGAIYKTFTQTAARYWRVDLADNDVASNLQIGRAVLMPAWTIDRVLLFGWGVTWQDDSPKRRSRGGQKYPDVLPRYRVLEFTLGYLTEDEVYDNAFAAARANGAVKDVLAIPHETGARVSEQAVWGTLAVSEPVVHVQKNIFRQKFRIEEAL